MVVVVVVGNGCKVAMVVIVMDLVCGGGGFSLVVMVVVVVKGREIEGRLMKKWMVKVIKWKEKLNWTNLSKIKTYLNKT